MQGGDTTGIISPGLPNITGTWMDYATSYPELADGAFRTADDTSHLRGIWSDSDTSRNKISFDASRSNAIYGASATVQPPAISLIPQIRY